MLRKTNFYINGDWIAPTMPNDYEVINPANEKPFAIISLGSKTDVDKAVDAANAAFETWRTVPHGDRVAKLKLLAKIYDARSDEMAEAISSEMGAPIKLAVKAQTASGLGHIKAFVRALEEFKFENQLRDDTPDEYIIHEPIGVCGLITPWNWPMNQVALKVIPAIGVGCTVILKPAEIAPMSSILFAEFMDEAEFPRGVFNLLNGDGPGVGEAMSAHPDIDMLSFTGSTRAGKLVTKAGADNVKRVVLELGGKGANIIFADTDVPRAVRRGVSHCFNNSGQSCNAPTRMLVERAVYDKAVEIAREAAEATLVGMPEKEGSHIGPLVSKIQFDKVQDLIGVGVAEGARLIAGGLGRPEGFNKGYFVRPTVFADVTNEMRIAREEIFGPVLSIIPFETEDEAVKISNDTSYGLTDYVQTGDNNRLQRVARQLRAGMVQANGAARASGSPFGGYKQSGNGREGGIHGFMEYLEVKAISGWSSEY
ncbi:MAG: aldehyde dehydrogenase family protein [Rhodospirillaceae bacterium TMED8]|nr:aldehyde dehydrogenase family protein [Magnetovibrio sp.]OUT48072.1 MAG: aldehyde dehydrogenase family protein [Rhodospirillaceae bacterium TMED8]